MRLFGSRCVVVGGLERCRDGVGARLVSALLDRAPCVCLVEGLQFRGRVFGVGGYVLGVGVQGAGCGV